MTNAEILTEIRERVKKWRGAYAPGRIVELAEMLEVGRITQILDDLDPDRIAESREAVRRLACDLRDAWQGPHGTYDTRTAQYWMATADALLAKGWKK